MTAARAAAIWSPPEMTVMRILNLSWVVAVQCAWPGRCSAWSRTRPPWVSVFWAASHCACVVPMHGKNSVQLAAHPVHAAQNQQIGSSAAQPRQPAQALQPVHATEHASASEPQQELIPATSDGDLSTPMSMAVWKRRIKFAMCEAQL